MGRSLANSAARPARDAVAAGVSLEARNECRGALQLLSLMAGALTPVCVWGTAVAPGSAPNLSVPAYATALAAAHVFCDHLLDVRAH